jgi:tetratricopeptide (TPR) repeat protein
MRLEAGNSQKARPLLQRALAAHRSHLGENDPQVASDLRDLGRVLQEAEEADGARDCYAKSLAILERTKGPDDPGIVPVLIDFSSLIRVTGDSERAYALAERALTISTRAFAPNDLRLVKPLGNIAIQMVDRGEYARRTVFEDALAIARAKKGRPSIEVPRLLTGLGRNLIGIGDLQGARSSLEEAMALWEKLVPPSHPEVRTTLNQLARTLKRLEDYDAAIQLRLREIAIIEHAYGGSMCTSVTRSRTWGSVPARGHSISRNLRSNEPAIAVRHDPRASRWRGPERRRASMVNHDYLGARRTFERRARSSKSWAQAILSSRSRSRNSPSRALTRGHQGALETAIEVEDGSRRHFRATARGLSESEAIRFGMRRETGIDFMLGASALENGRKLRPGSLSRVLDEVIRSRAMVLDEMAIRHRETVADERRPRLVSSVPSSWRAAPGCHGSWCRIPCR